MTPSCRRRSFAFFAPRMLRAVRTQSTIPLRIVVFYVLEGAGRVAGRWEGTGYAQTERHLHVRPGMIHSHATRAQREAGVSEFVIVEKGQRSHGPDAVMGPAPVMRNARGDRTAAVLMSEATPARGSRPLANDRSGRLPSSRRMQFKRACHRTTALQDDAPRRRAPKRTLASETERKEEE